MWRERSASAISGGICQNMGVKSKMISEEMVETNIKNSSMGGNRRDVWNLKRIYG